MVSPARETIFKHLHRRMKHAADKTPLQVEVNNQHCPLSENQLTPLDSIHQKPASNDHFQACEAIAFTAGRNTWGSRLIRKTSVHGQTNIAANLSTSA